MSALEVYAVAFPFVMLGLFTIGAFWLTARDQKEAAREREKAGS